MAGYAGLFSNKYDTRANVNAGIDEMGMDWGRLSQPKYAGMAAAEGMMGYMSGLGNVNNAPEMQEQSLIDEIMAAHPDPKTPEELEALAADLAARGLTDYAFKVREIAQETKAQLSLTKTATDKANKPTKDLLDQVSFGLTSSILSDQFIDSYLGQTQPDYLKKYSSLAEDEKKGIYTPTEYAKKRDAAKKELENQFKSFRNYVSRQPNVSINELNSLLSNETLLKQAFKEWAKTNTNNEMAAFIDTNVFIDTRTKGTPMSEDGSEIAAETDIDKMVKELDPEVVKERIEMYNSMDERTISKEDKEIFESMKKLYPKLAMIDTTAFSNPQTQSWFEANYA